MDRAAVFVDAGYLFAAGSKLLSGERLARGDVHLDYDKIVEALTKLVTDLTGLPLLRIYWYDGTATGPTPQQLALAYRPSVKLRLGFVNQQGQQKGVDSLVVTDLINLARNRAMADALLMTGDEDLRVGVQQAQEFGVRVHLIGIEPARENQSGFLAQEADNVRELSLAEVHSTVGVKISKVPSVTATPTPMAKSATEGPRTKGFQRRCLAFSGLPRGGRSVPRPTTCICHGKRSLLVLWLRRQRATRRCALAGGAVYC